MTNDLRPYPEYKSSGIEWLGKVPAHWEVKPVFTCYTPTLVRNKGMQETKVLSLSYGRIVVKPPEKLHGLVPESFETYQIVKPGDIIIRPTDLQNDHTSLRVGSVGERGIITSAYLCLRCDNAFVSSAYGYHFLNVWDITKAIYGYGSGLRQNLDFSHFRRMPMAIPPLEEQAAIARYLSAMDRRVRRFIRNRRELIKLLNEQTQAIINQAVTRGLDPDVPLKPSGIEWLGDIPEHWEISRLGRQLLLNDSGVWGTAFADDGVIVLRSTEQTVDGRWRINAPARRVLTPSEREGTILAAGDLLVTKSSGSAAHIGKATLVSSEIASMSCCFSNFMQRLRLRPNVNSRFAWYVLNAPLAREQFRYLARSTTGLGNLSGTTLDNIYVYLPPLEEQTAIVNFLEANTSMIDAAITIAQRGIDLITEYRTRMIADVVTGKLDVRHLAPDTDEELAETIGIPDDTEPLQDAEELLQAAELDEEMTYASD